MSFNFPNSPTEGATFTPVGGYQYVFTGGVWRVVESPQVRATAETRSRIVNGAMQISQEQGNTAGTVTSYYAADQWNTAKVHSAGTITTQRVQSVTPNGSKDRFRVTITAADASLASNEDLYITQNVEGSRVADFRYGTASAKQSILRFGFKAPAGTYSISLWNGAANRSYVALFAIAAGQANIDTEQTFIIPGDTTGTWLTDTGIGMYVNITLACGATLQGAAGWQAGLFLGTSAVSNGMATAGAIYELYDVGLYLDPDATGLAPKWQMPDEAQELQACKRYWFRTNSYPVPASAANLFMVGHPVETRVAPAVTFGGPGFTVGFCNTTGVQCWQTTSAYSNLQFNARM